MSVDVRNWTGQQILEIRVLCLLVCAIGLDNRFSRFVCYVCWCAQQLSVLQLFSDRCLLLFDVVDFPV